MTWLILVLVIAAFVAGARTGYRDGVNQPRPPCPLCAARAADAAEIADLNDLYQQPAYGDD